MVKEIVGRRGKRGEIAKGKFIVNIFRARERTESWARVSGTFRHFFLAEADRARYGESPGNTDEQEAAIYADTRDIREQRRQ